MTTGLYAQVLGDGWELLHESVRQLHAAGSPMRAGGVFRVCRGGWLARGLASVARLPHAGEAVPLRLVITPLGEQEEWHRSFGGRPFVSRQWKHADGLLAEHLGILTQRFRLQAVDGSLRYQTEGAAFRLGRVVLPLPRWLAPRISASETQDGNGVAVVVEAHLPLLGLLVAYTGKITIEESETC